jgi:hypothetical protein
VFEPLDSVFWGAVRERRPELYKGFNPWDRISRPEDLRALLAAGGIPSVDQVQVVAENGWREIGSPEDAWSIVLGSGYRGTLEQLSPADRTHVRAACTAFVRAESVRAVEANVVYAVVTRD